MTNSKVFEEFGKLLDKKIDRKDKNSSITRLSEDGIRYLFYHVFIKNKEIDPLKIELESNHSNLERKKIDMCAQCKGMNYYFEFKYHKKMPNYDSDRTWRSASIVKDIIRLHRQVTNEKDQALLIYVSDEEMIKYYNSDRNGFKGLIDLSLNQEYKITNSFFNKKSKLFLETIGNKLYNKNNFKSITIRLIFKRDLNSKNVLYIYRIRSNKVAN